MLEQLTPLTILGIIGVYFLVLFLISFITSRGADNDSFFLANRQSPWIVVAIGMIGASLSGVTFISIPGWVESQSFGYMQMVMGYLLGYLVIGGILMPLYYRLNLTSIYTYLHQRLGRTSYKMGAAYFLLSRTIGASFRLYLVAIVLQEFVMNAFGIPFWATVLTTIGLIWIYTHRGGIKTIIWTDTLQTLAMLTAVVLTVVGIGDALDTDVAGLVDMVQQSDYSQVFFFEGGWQSPNNFFKQFISGALIAIVMTGLDQDMMQKNLSCRNIKEAQMNMATFSIVLIFANLLFLGLGALLYIYSANVGLPTPERTDLLFPSIALEHLHPFVGIAFVIGLIAAAYSSADSALTSLTTSFCIDFLGFQEEENEKPEEEKKKQRLYTHIGFSLLLFIVILIFYQVNNDAVIKQLFIAAGYTYGPILGLFSFGMLTNLKVREYLDFSNYEIAKFLPKSLQKINLVVLVTLSSPIIAYFINLYSKELLWGFEFGFLIIALNGIITFLGLLSISFHDTTEDTYKEEV